MSEAAKSAPDLRAPFPYFGGKRRVAAEVWERFGDVANYVEPFFGSGAVLLGRPHADPKTETVNDANGFVANFWRALQAMPEAVCEAADWPVNELDLHARHSWLNGEGARLSERLRAEPDFCDAKIAGWWIWGQCQWIGRGWCDNSYRAWQQRPELGKGGHGVLRRGNKDGGLPAYLAGLAQRLRRVRVCCGDWSRVVGTTATWQHGMTGVFLDPPYSFGERAAVYSHETDCAADARAWAIENGTNPLLRIALCGYVGEHAMPEDWECLAWKSAGGYGLQGTGRGRDNADRERVWFSPSCLTLAALQERMDI